jgi:hypothetical protein
MSRRLAQNREAARKSRVKKKVVILRSICLLSFSWEKYGELGMD